MTDTSKEAVEQLVRWCQEGALANPRSYIGDLFGMSADTLRAMLAEREAHITATIQTDTEGAEPLTLNERAQTIFAQAIARADEDERSGLNQRIGIAVIAKKGE